MLALEAQNVDTDRRHDRRALTDEELARLVHAAAAGPTRMNVPPAERAMLYRLAAETGLRAGELRQLRRCDLHLTGTAPTVTLPAAASKNRKAATLPLRPGHRRRPGRPAVGQDARRPRPARPRPASTSPKMVRADLAAARAAWLDEAGDDAALRVEREGSDLLAYRDRDGRVADFHALRHTFITNVVNGGASVKVAQRLARHSTAALTLDRYAHAGADQLAEAVATLPATVRAEIAALADGTTGRTHRPATALNRAPSTAPKPGVFSVTDGDGEGPNPTGPAGPGNAKKPR